MKNARESRRVTEQTAELLSVEISVCCDAWLSACPEAEILAEAAARAVLEMHAARLDKRLILGIVLTDDSEQRELNRTWRGKDAPTNVLSFTGADPSATAADAPLLLGDVVLAFETVAREAAEQHKTLSDHLCHLVVHGVLHLVGFDHEIEIDATEMEASEVEILHRLGVPDPYCGIM